jgi:hypothetical protein
MSNIPTAEEFIPYEQAQALKQLGFDEPCMGYRDGGGHLMIKEMPHCAISAPTFSQTFRWFREKYNLKFHIREDNWNNWCSVYILISDEHERVGDYLTYEEAELECLKKLIQIIKK